MVARRYLGMLRSCAVVVLVLLAVSTLLPAWALAQTVPQNIPPPGTIEDASKPIRLIADGPPRSLIKMDPRPGPIVAAITTDKVDPETR